MTSSWKNEWQICMDLHWWIVERLVRRRHHHCFLSFGEVVNIYRPRKKQSGKPGGFCFLCYRDQASTILAVDNFNGTTLLGRTLRVDYVEEYKVPKYREDAGEDIKRLWEEGCAPKPIQWIETRSKERLNKPGNPIRCKTRRKKNHRKEKRMKDNKKNLFKSGKTSAVKIIENNKTKNNGSCVEAEALRDRKEAFVYNPRPEFRKANWRDLQIWEEIRKREKEVGNDGKKLAGPKYEDHFIPNRYR